MKENIIAIGILAALADEIRDLIEAMAPGAQVHRIGMRDYHHGLLHGHECVIALTRVGKAAAAATTATLLQRFEIDRVIFTGVAGGLHAEVQVGDVVIGTEALQHDMDARPLFPRYELPLLGLARLQADAELSRQLAHCAERFLRGRASRVHRGLIATGDRFVGDADTGRDLRASLPDALCVEMEGAAVAQVCHEFGVPWAVLRTISDHADPHADIDFLQFLREVASVYSSGILSHYLRTWPLAR
ncbi:5'-methylthioadenosine/S-adenosylhomocysteine nucleosidase [Bordetella hinzii]|nr:5'-methylthioadenosine/S-adenosylhomocysteine nucleosidase [Bordetella hinzii]QDJ45707.1 5'-methylthioadenosine/S-adenosylhomocysteine nucleosidase [Bordetella hinzii]QDJ50106.1 5'-methylthioadenosine/S-adenosylhomocysteine nucleosidase [Bordetella hinzii]QWF41289.1 5'-methylthioadenosine/adenosylhomocysteine nucleosidase [Bordetella hinzii]QWF45830.1 5'-methylthioadenosine/adenosylhomocysteine nucleosidase [Bordetella hinzii]